MLLCWGDPVSTRPFAVNDKFDSYYKRLQGCSSIKEGVEILTEVGGEIGFPLLGVASDLSTSNILHDEDGRPISESAGWPRSFINEWVKDNYTLQDPITIRCQLENLPFFCDLRQMIDADSLCRPQKKIIRKWLHVGVQQVVAVPVHLPRARVAAVAFASKGGHPQPFDVHEWSGRLLAIGHLFMNIAMRNEAGRQAPHVPVHLTPREVECLTWAAHGKSDQIIAAICALSPATVRSYIDSAASKLGATTRTQAVSVASSLGLISRSTLN